MSGAFLGDALMPKIHLYQVLFQPLDPTNRLLTNPTMLYFTIVLTSLFIRKIYTWSHFINKVLQANRVELWSIPELNTNNWVLSVQINICCCRSEDSLWQKYHFFLMLLQLIRAHVSASCFFMAMKTGYDWYVVVLERVPFNILSSGAFWFQFEQWKFRCNETAAVVSNWPVNAFHGVTPDACLVL